jgi:hypothetical protein
MQIQGEILMERKKMITFITGGALVLVSVFGAVTSQVVKAQTTTLTPAAPTAPQAGGQPGFGRGMHGDGATEQDLATALGITLEKLQAAEQAATTAALKQAVADGTITQAQADQFAQSGQNGHLGGGLPFLRDSSIDTNALLAKELGISTADLQAARQKATFAELDQAVIAGRMTQQQADAAKGAYTLSANAKFQAAMTSAYQAAVNQAVTDGTITQAQADQLLKNATVQNWAAGGDRGGFGGRGGGPGGPGGQGGMNPFNGSAPANPGTAPTASPTPSGTNG